MAPPRIRRAEATDLPRLAEVSLAADTLFAAAGVPLPPDDDPEGDLAACDWILLAELPGRPEPTPVGFAAVIELGGAAHLRALGVHPDHGRRGIGSLLLERACAEAADLGYSAMTLTTFAEVPFNAPWYARRGFASVPDTEQGPELAEQFRREGAALQHLSPRVAMRRRLR